MRTQDSEKSSNFAGVCKHNKGSWRAQYAIASYRQIFKDEMEAAAHFTWVFCISNGEGEASGKMLIRNIPWVGRIPLEEMGHALDNGKYQFPINMVDKVLVDSDDYTDFKDDYYFLRGGQVVTINGCQKVGKEFRFFYTFLASKIYTRKVGTDVWRNCLPHFVDGNPLNLQRSNLEQPKPEEPLPLREKLEKMKQQPKPRAWVDDPLSWPDDPREETDEGE